MAELSREELLQIIEWYALIENREEDTRRELLRAALFPRASRETSDTRSSWGDLLKRLGGSQQGRYQRIFDTLSMSGLGPMEATGVGAEPKRRSSSPDFAYFDRENERRQNEGLSLGLTHDEIPLYRRFPVAVYLSQESGDVGGVADAARELFDACALVITQKRP